MSNEIIDNIYDVIGCAFFLRLPESKLLYLVATNEIPYIILYGIKTLADESDIHDRVRFLESSLIEWLKEKEVK